MNENIALIIPALNPEKALIAYIRDCIQQGFWHIVVVNDGSEAAYEDIFTQLESFAQVTVLKHEENRGKGRALKTALAFCQQQAENWQLKGVVTVDSDGQHILQDVCCMAEAMDEKSLVLGCRDLLGDNVPPKSRFGNLLTCRVFWLLYGKWITDTQTGLRGIPLADMELFLKVRGERYEYETEMLITAVRNQIPIKELPIETIYIEENSGTHFRPVVDSVKIYAVMMRCFFLYTFFSLSSSILDLLLFFLLNHVLFAELPQAERILLSTAAARIFSSIYNFTMNRKVVFDAEGGVRTQLIKYYGLVVVQMLASAELVTLLINLLPFPDTVVKILVDVCLFFLSFQIQKRWIFKPEQKTVL